MNKRDKRNQIANEGSNLAPNDIDGLARLFGLTTEQLRQQVDSLDDTIHHEGPFKGFPEYEVQAAYRLLADKGFKIMHRRNGQFWLMFDRPLTFAQVDQFASTDFIALNGEAGHLEFKPLSGEAGPL